METPSLLGKTIGAIRTHLPHQYHDNSFETASWYETSELPPGIYPIQVGIQTYGRQKPLSLYAQGQGVVIDAFFPSSFGGVMFGGSNRENYVGKRQNVKISIGWIEAIQRTGNSESSTTPDLWIHPEFMPEIEEHFRKRLVQTLEGFDRMRPATFEDRDKTGTIMHHAQWVAEDAQILGTIQQKIWSDDSHKDSSYWQGLIAKNTHWATEAWESWPKPPNTTGTR
jgi:hypothetical protein